MPLDSVSDSLTEGARVYLRPFGFLDGATAAAAVAAGLARPLAGGPAAFMGLEIISRDGRRITHSLRTVADLAREPLPDGLAVTLARLSAARPPLRLRGGRALAFDHPRVMGILNVTPDSFSDGGHFAAPERALLHGRAMLAAGADLLDIGGESTRPGSDPVPPAEEQRRVLPVVAALAADGAMLSIDTRNAATMRAASAAGAQILNDVSALTHDPESVAAARDIGGPVVLMHARGDPKTMQDAPRYDAALLDVHDDLAARVEAVTAATGIARDQIVIDPGIGFGKGLEHNLDVLQGLGLFHGLGCPLLLGVSRKSFIGRLSGGAEAGRRLPGSLAAALKGVLAGVQILRVHDVADTVQALTVWDAV